MRHILLYIVIVVAAFITKPATALDTPSPSQYDGRIQYVDFNEGDVVPVHAAAGLGSEIVFSPGEEILDTASGFSQGWEFSGRRNILYLKPKSVKTEGSGLLSPEPNKWNTNLLVTTNQHMYAFDLYLMPNPADIADKPTQNSNISYRIQFRYPQQQAEIRKEKIIAIVNKKHMAVRPRPVNWNYVMQIGRQSDSIAPTMAYDDGRFTYLRFPNNRDFPAVFLVSADKSESLVNSHVEASKPHGAKDMLVVHRVARQMVLRLGHEVVGIYNDSFDADGVAPRDGMAVPGMRRVLRVISNSQSRG